MSTSKFANSTPPYLYTWADGCPKDSTQVTYKRGLTPTKEFKTHTKLKSGGIRFTDEFVKALASAISE